MENVVYIKQNRCLTNSKELAKAFGKQHKDVLRKIEQQLTDMPEDLRRRNFTPTQTEFKMPTGGVRQDRMYEMTKDGFMAVALTFTGKKAAAFRWAVIEEFNRRGAELEKRGLPTLSTEELLEMAVTRIRERRAEKKTTEFSNT